MKKYVSDSRAEHVEIVFQQHVTSQRRLFGGVLMSWIDVVAAVVARRHSHREVTTVAVDNLQFRKPIYLSDTVVLVGQITWTGTKAMEVRVDTFTEKLNGERIHVNRAYLVLLALDQINQPVPIPQIEPVTDEEKLEFEDGQRRQKIRLERREAGY